MGLLIVVLLLTAAVLFGVAGFGARWDRARLIAWGLLAWVIAVTLPHL